jgi:hypothetical protein
MIIERVIKLNSSNRDLEKIRDILEVQVKRNGVGRAVNADDDADDLRKCNTYVDQGWQRFQVSDMHNITYHTILTFILALYIDRSTYQ